MTAVLAPTFTSRELPPAEWPRLAGTELEELWPKLQPADTRIVVVERDGAIVAAWAVLRLVHVEGIWIAPEHRRGSAVGRRLLLAMYAAARAFGASGVCTGAETDDVKALIAKAGGVHVPYDSYVLPVPPERRSA